MADDAVLSPAGTRVGVPSPTLTDAVAPDAVTIPEAQNYDERYDSDFEYLTNKPPKASEGDGTEKKGAEPSPATEEHTPEGKKDDKTKIDVPPIAQTAEPQKKDDKVVPSAPPSDDGKVNWEKRHNDLQSFHDTTVSTLKKELETAKAELESLQSLKVVKEEVEKNPHAFLVKYYPQLAEQVNPNKIIVEQLKKEFGADFDAYDANDALKEGTASFKIQQRLDELRTESQRARLEAEVSRREESRKREELLTASKNKVMKDYGLSEEQFQKQIVEYAKSLPPNFETIAKVRYFDWHIQRAVDEALKQRRNGAPGDLPRSVAGEPGHTGDEDQASPAYKELANEFGDM